MTEKSIQEMAVCLAPWFWAANNNVSWLSGISEEKNPGKYESWMTFCWYAVGAFDFTTCDFNSKEQVGKSKCSGPWQSTLLRLAKGPQPSSYDNNTTLKRIISWPQKHINWMKWSWHQLAVGHSLSFLMYLSQPPPWCQILALEVGSLKRCWEVCKTSFLVGNSTKTDIKRCFM